MNPLTSICESLDRHIKISTLLISAAIAIAGICYTSWVLEFILPIHGNPANSFLSELSAEGRPYREVFSTADKIAGTLLIPASIAGLLIYPRGRLIVVGWVALLSFALGTIADAALPLRQCKAIDGSCDSGDSGLFPQLQNPHALTSSVAIISITISICAFSLAAFRHTHWQGSPKVGPVCLISGAVGTIWMLIADNLPGHNYHGIAQRIQASSISFWLLTLAATVFLQHRRRS